MDGRQCSHGRRPKLQRHLYAVPQFTRAALVGMPSVQHQGLSQLRLEMNYTILYLKSGGELIASESSDEYPTDKHLEERKAITGADYYDISRKDGHE